MKIPGQVNIIKQFTIYFKDKASKIIEQAEHHKITFPHHHNAIQTFSMKDLQELFADIKITPRQMECINLLLEGATTKEIATKLKLSPRTVEYYIDLVRAKFQAKNKQELIIKLLGYKSSK